MNAEVPIEMEFVVATVRPEPDVGRIETIAARDPNWERIVQEAVNRHQLGPLLYRNLTESGSADMVPEAFVERLRQCSRRTATRNLSLVSSLRSILRSLRKAGLPALPYKGPVLSEAIYGDFSLRQSRDLDILVRPGDLFDAEAVLVEQGFERDRELTGGEKRLLAEKHRQRTVRKDGLIVELHPRVSSPDPPFDVTALFDRAGSIDLAGDSFPAIQPVDHLCVLSVHGTRHRWNQLKWVCDIGYLIKSEDFDWPMVLEEAKRRRCQRRVLLGCGLASAILGVEFPDVLRSALRDQGPGLIGDTYPDCLLGIDDATSLRYRLRSRDTTFDRLHYLWNKLTVPTVRVKGKRPIPERLFGLYYLLQPFLAIGTKTILTARALVAKLRERIRERD